LGANLSDTSLSDAIETLDYFCAAETKVDYALLIDAPWGAGKTQFLRAYMRKRDATADPLAPKALFVSLFGMTKAAEVHSALFAAAHPVLAAPQSRFFAKVGAGLLKKHVGLDLDGASELAKLVTITASVIVFDDFERASMPPSEVLGLINSFAESGEFKVIVIANESEVLCRGDGIREAYRRQKEKVIGRTLTVRADPAEVLQAFIREFASSATRSAIEANAGAILRVFEASGLHNFRSLRHGLSDFDRVVRDLDPLLAAAPKALKKLLVFVLALGMEIRAGRIEVGDAQNLGSSLFHLDFGLRDSAEVSRVRDLVERYADVSWRDPIVPPSVLVNLIVSGVLAKADANAVVTSHPDVVGSRELKSWVALWYWQSLSRTEYLEARSRLLDDLENARLTHPGEILHATGELMSLAEAGDALFEDCAAAMTGYIERLERADRLLPNLEFREGLDGDSWAGRVFQGMETSGFQRVREVLQAAADNALQRRAVELAKQFMAGLANGSANVENLYERDVNEGGFGNVAALNALEVDAFASHLVKDFRINDGLLAALAERYDRGSSSSNLLDEASWFTELKALLLRRVGKAPPPFAKSLPQRLAASFDRIEASFTRARSYKAMLDAAGPKGELA